MPAAAAAQTQAQHGSELPLSGTLSAATKAAFPSPGTLQISLDGDGIASHLGRFKITGVDTGTFPEPVAIGAWVFTAADKDQLFASTESRGEPAGDGTDHVTVKATISGGTGHFAGATGSFTAILIGTHDVSTGSGTVSGSFDGQLNLNR
jgi:hypothetical protein